MSEFSNSNKTVSHMFKHVDEPRAEKVAYNTIKAADSRGASENVQNRHD